MSEISVSPRGDLEFEGAFLGGIKFKNLKYL